ncbi:MAG: hypothetical protein LW701_10015 [Fluviicola sp.]|nr:hypothetical protein [Fluviicola sp.]
MRNNLHSIIAFIVISAFVMQALGKFIIYTDYIINKEYIANNLCINKSKPILKCNGKCHLAKQLKKQDQKENKSSSSKEKVEIISSQVADVKYEVIDMFFFQNNNQDFFNYNKKIIDDNFESIFQPPRV